MIEQDQEPPASDKITEEELLPLVEPEPEPPPKLKRKPVPPAKQIRDLRTKLKLARQDLDEYRIYVAREQDRLSAVGQTSRRVSEENGRLRQAVINLQVDGKMTGLPWLPTHVHLKSGKLYRVLRRGKLESTLEDVVIYENQKNEVWVRDAVEFDDGRFLEVTP